MSFMEDARWFHGPGGPSGAPRKPGRVTLVGAGPGDPELLTLKAAKALRFARLVLYDHLVSPEVLRHVAEDADLVYVGKQSARHTLSQEAIIDLMLRLARNGRSLVRLKGGDGYIFGRGGEEAQALAASGIDFEVIPGITAAQGAAASAGIPLTHRDHAATLVFATGHLRDGQEAGLDWELLARPRQTVVIYMGVAALAQICEQLVAHGLPASTPAAIVERATLPTQRCIVGTLQSLPQCARDQGVQTPALIVVGEVVSLHAQLQPAAPVLAPLMGMPWPALSEAVGARSAQRPEPAAGRHSGKRGGGPALPPQAVRLMARSDQAARSLPSCSVKCAPCPRTSCSPGVDQSPPAPTMSAWMPGRCASIACASAAPLTMAAAPRPLTSPTPAATRATPCRPVVG